MPSFSAFSGRAASAHGRMKDQPCSHIAAVAPACPLSVQVARRGPERKKVGETRLITSLKHVLDWPDRLVRAFRHGSHGSCLSLQSLHWETAECSLPYPALHGCALLMGASPHPKGSWDENEMQRCMNRLESFVATRSAAAASDIFCLFHEHGHVLESSARATL